MAVALGGKPTAETAARSARKLAVSCLLGGLLVGAILSFGSYFALLRVLDDTPSSYELVIPAGTARLVSQGADPPTIPSSIKLRDGGTFIVRNQDVVAHQIAQYSVGPGETRELPFPAQSLTNATKSTFVCSLHPGSAIELALDKPPPVASNLIPMFAIGLPLALVSFVVLSITTRLE